MSDLLAELVNVEKFARELKKHPRSIHRWMAAPNGLPFVKLGAERYIHMPSAREWILSRIRRPNPDRRSRRKRER
jgi:hypothetical protein